MHALRLPPLALPLLASLLLGAGCTGGNSRPSSPDTCEYALDGECDEPEYCADGTDTTDCGDDTCEYANDGECDEPEYCNFGTDTTDCRAARLCEPQCGNQVCGNDPVCGKSCGSCGQGQACTDQGQCAACTPDCSGRSCGVDPVCGVSCGGCGANQTCDANGQCVNSGCTPDCSGRSCGADPVCGESCGTCGGDQVCDGSTGQCASPCEGGRTLCDGVCVDTSNDPAHCGGCNACPMGNLCENGSCVEPPQDCRQEPCRGFSYCDLATGQCLPGCAGSDQCGVNETCDLAAHTCDCITDYIRCNGTCVENDDLPDLNYEDANCDGIDGNASNAIYVSLGGNDNNPGTMAQPLRTIEAGMAAARNRPRPEVFIAAGVYNLTESLQLRDYVSLYGGYDASNGWARSASSITEIRGPSPVLDGSNWLEGPLAIQGLKIVGTPGTLMPGESAYGILVRSGGGTLFIQGNEIVPGPGGDGAPGLDGDPGDPGDPGGNAGRGSGASGGSSCGRGGTGGLSTSVHPGGGGVSSNLSGRPGNDGQPMGLGGTGGDGGSSSSSSQKHGSVGGDGMPGTDGMPGAAVTNATGSIESNRFLPGQGNDGDWGTSGGGGGGGGAGAYLRSEGGGGGGGGAGGCGGDGGGGGGGGGGSFGIFMVGGAVETGQNRFMSGPGGAGGSGGAGGAGGTGGSGGNGGNGQYSGGWTSGDGGDGGPGGAGGSGGGGSGGPGGPAIGVFISNGAHSPTNDQLIGAQGGTGGAGGTGAPAGPTGRTFRVFCESGTCTTVVN